MLLLAVSTAGCSKIPVGFYEIRISSGIEYVARDDVPVLMDVVEPVDAPSPRPCVLMIHGGAWKFGNRLWMRPMVDFLAKLGYTTATIDYRLTPGGVYPRPVQDALAAIKFLRLHASEYGIDPDRMAIGGDSAGGQLALLAGMAPDSAIFKDDTLPDVSTKVQAIIDIYGPTDMPKMVDASRFLVRGQVCGYMGCPADEHPERWKEASALSYVRADLPPILIIHGKLDSIVPYVHAERLAEALEKAGAPYRLVPVPGAEHGWLALFESRESLRTLPAIVQFLAEIFPPTPIAAHPRIAVERPAAD